MIEELYNIYEDEDRELMLEEDLIEGFEEGFMRGYMAS
tara:strand:- start:344 stop:457 length:114 start_codon:yes stop_codon:yes gene_type:complete